MRTMMALILAGIVCTLPPVAPAASVESVYTSLTEADCSVIERDTDVGSFARERCPGVAGYALDLVSGDLRQSLDVLTPAGKTFSLDLISTVSGGFSFLGNKAEWRVKRVNQRKQPIALIVRFNVSEDPDNSEKITSYLVVSKITANGICVTDVVKPMHNANERARQLADKAADKACRQ